MDYGLRFLTLLSSLPQPFSFFKSSPIGLLASWMERGEVKILDFASLTQTLRSAQNGNGKISNSYAISWNHNKAALKYLSALSGRKVAILPLTFSEADIPHRHWFPNDTDQKPESESNCPAASLTLLSKTSTILSTIKTSSVVKNRRLCPGYGADPACFIKVQSSLYKVICVLSNTWISFAQNK
jgi:hypothetical protein